MANHNKTKWPTFDGRAEEYELWEERMLCCMHRVGLKETILNEPGGPLSVAEQAEEDKLNADAYCALAPLLDNVSLGLIFRDTKNKGRESLQVLREHYIGKGRPRIVSMYITLTSLKKADTETVTEYIIRAEQIITALKGAGEAPSEGLMMAMIMRGLPEKYKPFTLMVTHSSADMKLAEFKAKLRNFEASEDAEPVAEEAGERVLKARAAPKKKYGGSSADVACWRCGEKGHRKDECTKKAWCSSCKSTSHTDKACRKKERAQSSRCARVQDDSCGSSGGRAANRGGRIDARGPARDDFTFRAETEDTCKPARRRQIGRKGLIVDTGASSHILNDRSRFKTFDSSFWFLHAQLMAPRKNAEDIEELRRAIEILTEEVSSVKTQQKGILSLVEEIKALRIQNAEKDKKIKRLESRVAELEQHARLNEVIVTGLRVKPRSYARAVTADEGETNTEMQESTEQQVTSFFQSKGIELDNGSIEACFPITKRNAGARQAILIRFCNRKHKTALLKEGRKLKGTDVYVNEHLTKQNAEIAKQARFLRKLKKIQQTWTVNGKIFIKLNGAPEEAKVIQVRSMEELRKFQ